MKLKKEIIFIFTIFAIAYIIRGIPSWLNWGWGNDFGIYYGLTKKIVEEPQLFPSYSGWGGSYNYFPLLYILIAAFHVITGLDIVFLLKMVAPIIGSLSVVIFYYIIKTLKKDESNIAFLSALILALNPFHAYQTSHAAPLTIGHFFLMLSLLLFFKKEEKGIAMPCLYISTILLIISHHLTTFIYIFIILGITVFRKVYHKDKGFHSNVLYFIFLTSLTFSYWKLVAKPVFQNYISPTLNLSPILFLLLFYLFVSFIFVFINIYKFNFKTKIYSERKELIMALLIFIILFSFAIVFCIDDFGTGFKFKPTAIILLLPTFLFAALAAIGWNRMKMENYEAEIKGMFYSLVAIFFFSIIIENTVLIARLIEYLAYPFSALAALGMLSIMKRISIADIEIKKAKATFSAFFVAMFLTGATTYNVQKATLQYEESISVEVYKAIKFLENISANVTIASDHRISTLLWANGFNATYDYVYHLWHSASWNETCCIRELKGFGLQHNFGRIEYVIIDSVMVRDGIQSNINETPKPIDAKAYNKFNHEPFELIFEAKSKEKLMSSYEWEEAFKSRKYADEYPYIGSLDEPLPNAKEWCRIYKVNWTYIESYKDL